MKRAITFGAFDLLHYGHLRLLARMAALADSLLVGLASDAVIQAGKGQYPFYNYDIRREMLLHTRHVDQVLCHDGPIDGTGRVLVVAQKIRMIQEYNVDLMVMGSDWRGEYEFLQPYCDVVYLERTPHISTSAIRRRLAQAPPAD